MKTYKLLVSALMLLSVLLSACTPAQAAPTFNPTVTVAPADVIPAISSTVILPTATFVPTPAPPPSDSAALTMIAGVYSYKVGAFTSTMLFVSDGGYRGPSVGLFGVTADQNSFADGFSCASQPGTYQWSLKATSLTFTLVHDDCQNRIDFFSKTVFEKAVENKTSASVVWAISLSFNRITTDPNRNIYAQVDYYPPGSRAPTASYFSEFDTNGKPLGDWQNGIGYPTGIVVDSDGNIYVADFSNAVIYKFDPNKNPLLSWTVDTGKTGPVGVGVDAQGNIYIALHRIHDHYVEKYDPQGKLLGTWAKPVSAGGEVVASDYSGPDNIAVDGKGNNYLVDPDNTTVIKYDANGKFLQTFTNVMGVAVDAQGNFYTSDSDFNILKFDSSGTQIGKWSLPIQGIVAGVDKDGYVLIQGNSLLAKIKLPEQ